MIILLSATGLAATNWRIGHSILSPVEQATTSTPAPLSFTPSPTLDPASIGDTSGVIAFGVIIVVVILIGVLWGTREWRQASSDHKPTQE